MRNITRGTMAVGLAAALLASVATPKQASADWHGGGGWGGGGWHDGWHGGGWGGGWGGGVGVGLGLGLGLGLAAPLYAPPPAYYAPPPVYYAPPAYYAPPPVYYAPPAATPTSGQGCYAGPYVCPLQQPVPAGTACSCPTQSGRAYGRSG